MAVARMKKVTILAYQDVQDDLFERLRDLGIMEVRKTTELPANTRSHGEDKESAERLSKLLTIKAYFERYTTVKKGLLDMFTGKKPEISREEFETVVSGYDLDEVFLKVQKHESRLKELSQEIVSRNALLEQIVPWEGLDLPLDRICSSTACSVVLFTIPVSKQDELLQESCGLGNKVWEIGQTAGYSWIVLNEDKDHLLQRISSSGGTVVDYSQWLVYPEASTVRELISSLTARIKAAEEEIEAIKREGTEMASDLIHVLALVDHIQDERNLDKAMAQAGETDYTLVVEGFVRARDVQKLTAGLSDLRDVHIEYQDATEADDPPVFLENHPIIRPFEVITNIFGYPKYNEVDPTPILAPFFWVFYGMCLGDAVYGIVQTLVCWLFLKKVKPQGDGDKLPRLLMYCGVSTTIAGALMGSWLADLPTVLFPGTPVEWFVKKLTLLDPVANPLTLLIVSFALGIVQVWVGIVVKMYSTIRAGDVKEAILSSGSWVLFLPGLVGTGLAKVGVLHSQVPFWVMVAGALLIMYSSSRGQKNVLLKPFAGAYGLYSTVGYFSDTMSYARLLALGLASAIIGMVVNKIAHLFTSLIPYVGWVLFPIVLLGGHAFNLIINVLGSFIHSGRLQFVEFFTKFFEGGGRPFKPLTRVSENVSVLE